MGVATTGSLKEVIISEQDELSDASRSRRSVRGPTSGLFRGDWGADWLNKDGFEGWLSRLVGGNDVDETLLAQVSRAATDGLGAINGFGGTSAHENVG